MRVIPQPEVHVQQEYTPPPGSVITNNTDADGLNEAVDKLIGQYFDKNQIPYTNTIAIYYKYFVNVGNLDDVLKKKLRDICYYIVEVVIPNIPSLDNPEPKVQWTRLEWLADNWNAYNHSFNLDALSNFNLLTNLRGKYGGTSGNSGRMGSSGSGINESGKEGSDSSSSSALTPISGETSPNNNNANKSGNGSPTCNMACPTACEISGSGSSTSGSSKSSALARAASSATPSNWMNNKEKGFDYNSRGKNGSTGSNGLPGTSASGKILNGGSNGNNIVYEVIITDVPNKFPDSQQLNTYVRTKIIDEWFDTTENAERPLPSKYAISMFDLYTSGKTPMDRNHKNKLRDLVYYYMENIIPGLPSKDKPVSYVEWRPLRFLSNSDL